MTDNNDWLHRKPGSNVKPLTRAWYKGATTPRFTGNGEVYRVLTPPIGEEPDLPVGRMLGYIIVGVVVAIIIVSVVFGTASAWMK